MKPFLVVLVGATACGKTDFAIQLAKHISGEIISADSRTFYRGLNIGTAKPTMEQRTLIPHHLVDILEPDEPWSLSIFQEKANTLISEINSRRKIPILVGGTGQYIHSVTWGWSIPRQPPDDRLRSIITRIEKEIGAQALHSKLAILDPEAASHIQYQNVRRTIRALEVIFKTGQKFSSQAVCEPPKFDVLTIGLFRPRDDIYRRIDERLSNMLESGWLHEVEALVKAGYSFDLPVFSAIGYRELAGVVSGSHTLDEAMVLIKRKTREFVRRQANWFKLSDPTIKWVAPDPEGLNYVINEVKNRCRGGE
jgi:tRNA dimethylallyltransferase